MPGVVTALTYKNAPPIPARVVDSSGQLRFGREDIDRGQEVFLANGLIEHGTLWGHGAYLGPDYTAEHLHLGYQAARHRVAVERFGKSFDALSGEQRDWWRPWFARASRPIAPTRPPEP